MINLNPINEREIGFISKPARKGELFENDENSTRDLSLIDKILNIFYDRRKKRLH
jgi:hypothetical protein